MTTDLITELGQQPIAGPQPAGNEVREEPAFEQLEAELAKLASPVHSVTMDWNKVNQWSTELLSTRGKDLLVACYLAGGLLETRGLYGLADGLKVLADLLQTYWDTLYPGLKRMRGRRNALQWLIDRVQQRASETDWGALPPQEAELVARLVASLGAIDAVLAEKDSEAPSIRALQNLVNALTVIEEKPDPVPASAQAAAAPAAAGNTAPPATLLLDSADNVERALEEACTRLGSLAEWFLANDSSNPLSYRLNRTAAWSTLEALPPADGGQTRIAPPISQLTDALARLKDSQSDTELVAFAEAQLVAFPFWLDLNGICAAALGRMGSGFAAARQEVCNETARLLARLPGLEKLSFSSGMPFADGDTLDWLATLIPGMAAAAGGPASTGAGRPRDAVTAAIGNARALAANDDLASAAACLQEQLALQPPARDQLLLQIRLCELLLQHRPGAALKAFAQAVVQAIDRHQLGVWDPAMALDGLQVAYGVMVRNEEDRGAADALLARIVALDAATAVKLVT
jgi:type VI secretion system protein VasJ